MRRLRLGGRGLATLKAGDFGNPPALERLRLNGRLASLPGGIFDNLTKLEELDLSGNHLVGLTWRHPLFDNLWGLDPLSGEPDLRYQTDPPSLPKCQPNRGFPSCAEAEPDPPAQPDPEPDPPAPPPTPEPDPPDLAGRLAAAEVAIKALRDAIKIATAERQREDAAHDERLDDHAERLDAIEENLPPRRLRL